MTEDGTEQPQELQESEPQGKSGCCYTWIRYEGNEMAQAFAMVSALTRSFACLFACLPRALMKKAPLSRQFRMT